jgi:hypothetical protein
VCDDVFGVGVAGTILCTYFTGAGALRAEADMDGSGKEEVRFDV